MANLGSSGPGKLLSAKVQSAVVKCGKNYGGNSRNSRCQVQTYEMSEGTLASAYVLHPFQTLVPRFLNKEDGRWEIGGLE